MAKLFWSRLTEGRVSCEMHKGFSDTEVVTEHDKRVSLEVDGYVIECENCKFGF